MMLVKEGLLQIPFCAGRAFRGAGEGPEEVSWGHVSLRRALTWEVGRWLFTHELK